jgi:hypothetical protein
MGFTTTKVYLIHILQNTAMQGTGVLGLQLGSKEPYFVLLVDGEALLTETGQAALFTAIVAFVSCCRRKNAAIGGRSLEYLGLDRVMESSRKRLFNIRLLGRPLGFL